MGKHWVVPKFSRRSLAYSLRGQDDSRHLPRETMMNDKPLARNELTVFNFSHFSCRAQWLERKTHSLTAEYIEVRVSFNGSSVPLMVRNFPVDMTLREIKQRTAFYILKEIGVMWGVVHTYYEQHQPQGEE